MLLSTNQLFKKEVLAKDKSLGILVNVVFDRESREARLVVFPELKTHKRLGEVARSLGTLGGSVVSSVSYDVAGAASGLVTDVTYEGVRQAEQKMDDKSQEEAALYYLLPVSEVSNLEKDKIWLEMVSGEYEQYKNMRGTESDVAFFNDEVYREPERFVGISLNLTAVRGLNLKDQEDKRGRIIDIIFDPVEGVATHLVVKTIGKGAQPCYVKMDSVNLMDMTVSKRFEDCSPVNLPA